MQENARHTNGEEMHLMDVPREAVIDLAQAPCMQLEIVHLQQRGVMADPHHADVLSRMALVNGTGILHASNSAVIQLPAYRQPFTMDEIRDVILHHERYSNWLLRGFILRAYSLTLLYYNARKPDTRGVVELGRNFSSMQVNIDTPDESFSVHIWRTLLTSWVPFKRFGQQYMACQATFARRAKQPSTDSAAVVRREFSGTDTVHIDRYVPLPR